jgi:hypothetical protein
MAEDIHSVDIGLHLRGGGRALSDPSAVSFTAAWPDGKPVSAEVHLLTSRPYFGGVRYWYQCPKCGRRAGKLYFAGNLACRRCHGLVYRLQYRKDGLTALLHSVIKRRVTRTALRFVQSLAQQSRAMSV